MKKLSLKLDDQIFNEAIDYYNRYNKRKILATKLAKESELVQDESMVVLAEFERISHED